jgi:[acyl-carrier-protein] S-malonyltransferase
MAEHNALRPGQGSQAVGMGGSGEDPLPGALGKPTRPGLQTFTSRRGTKDRCFFTELLQPAIRRVDRAQSVRDAHAQTKLRRRTVLGIFRACRFRHVHFAEAVCTVRNRGKYMQEAVPVGVGAMAAILGMDLERVMAVCHDAAQGEVCEPANINSPEQIVISGNTAAVERAAKLADERGAKRAKLLPVSAPFHCSLMKPAKDRLESDLNALKMQKPVYPVACNVEAALVTDSARPRHTGQRLRDR